MGLQEHQHLGGKKRQTLSEERRGTGLVVFGGGGKPDNNKRNRSPLPKEKEEEEWVCLRAPQNWGGREKPKANCCHFRASHWRPTMRQTHLETIPMFAHQSMAPLAAAHQGTPSFFQHNLLFTLCPGSASPELVVWFDGLQLGCGFPFNLYKHQGMKSQNYPSRHPFVFPTVQLPPNWLFGLVVWVGGWFPDFPLQAPGIQIPKPPIQTTNSGSPDWWVQKTGWVERRSDQ